MKLQLKQFFSSSAYAVVGASDNREKFGNIAYRHLKEKHFTVYPVNPKHKAVEGDKCYASVSELPDEVKSVVLVVPPGVTEHVVVECKAKGITAIWMQPGAESFEAIEYAKSRDIAVIYDACIMVMLSPVKEYSQLNRWLAKATGVF